jgi:hypothetical protein
MHVPDPKTTAVTTPVCGALSTQLLIQQSQDYLYCLWSKGLDLLELLCCSVEPENPQQCQLHDTKHLCV